MIRGIDIWEFLGIMTITVISWPGLVQFTYEIAPNMAFELLGTLLGILMFMLGYLLAYEKEVMTSG